MVEKTEVEITRESKKLLSELVELVKKNKGDDYSVSSLEEVILKEEELKKNDVLYTNYLLIKDSLL